MQPTERAPEPDEPLVPEPPPVRALEFKAALLMALTLLLVLGSTVYVLFARGAFDPTQRLVLIADDAEGVNVGLDMTFAGFPIGRVTRVELGADGNARILIDVAEKNARWLRTSSIFTLERGLVGGTRLRAFSGVLDDPPLPAGAERTVLRGDVAAEIPQLTASVRALLDNLNAMTREGAAINRTLANLQATTDKLNGPHGALGVLVGNEADAKQLGEALARSNALIARADALAARLDGLVANADRQVFGQGAAPGEGSVVGDVRASVSQLNGLLQQARGSLQKLDAVLVEAQGVASNTRAATTDLGTLRADVESSLRKIDGLIDEVNRKWPFARDPRGPEIRLP